MNESQNIRCQWCESHSIYIKYHDEEWGVPVSDDQKHFEFLVLESAQAGLSWLTILKRRDNYRKAYQNFDPQKVALFNAKQIESLIQNTGIIRNRRKIEASIVNARIFLEIQKEFGSFNSYIRSFVTNGYKRNNFNSLSDIPTFTNESMKLAKDMKKRGFKFLGPTVMYAHMQAAGIVNDHLTSCFRYKEINFDSI